MSQFSDVSSNPYQSAPNAPRLDNRPKLPTFSLVVIIIDFFFLALRALMVLAGFAGLMSGSADPMVVKTGYFEVGTGILMVLTGVPANIGLLMRQQWGVYLAWVKVAATVGSMAVGIWQLMFLLERFQPGTPQFAGAMVGVVFGFAIRLLLLGLYVTAVMRCVASFKEAAAKSTAW